MKHALTALLLCIPLAGCYLPTGNYPVVNYPQACPPQQFSQNMHPVISTTGNTFLMPHSELRDSILNPPTPE